MFKKSFIWLLVLCMALVVVPITALAGETTDASSEAQTVATYNNPLYVNCDYNSETEGWGTTKFSNYAGAYAYATTNGKTNATIVVEKTNTLSGNTFDNNHKNYTRLAVVIQDGATMGNAASKWDMTYPVTVEPGGTLTCARPKSASVSNIHIKNTLTIGAEGATKQAYAYLLSDSYQDCDISIRYNGKIVAYNAVITIQDLDAQGAMTLTGCDVTVDGAFASATTFYKTTLTDSNLTVNGNQISGGLSDFAGGDSNRLGNVVLNNSSITIKEGTTVVAANVTATNSTIAVNDLTINSNKKLTMDADSALEAETLNLSGSIVGEGSVSVANVAKIGNQSYATLADALAAASAMTGDVTIEIWDKATLAQSLSGSYDSITFVGKTIGAEIYLDVQGYITATGKTVAFEDLILSKSAGGYIANAGFMNLAFGIYDVEKVTYTDCTFANGACASYGEVIFDGCTFYRSHDRYGLWAYGASSVTVNNCVFDDFRGIKMYAEGKAKTTDLTVKNTDFSGVTDKPAIVLTSGKSVTLAGNTYNPDKGVFELDLGGVPNGTPVTSDVAPTCVNDNGACGVLVDGKIYTTVAQAAEVAVAGSKVTLLHNSAETVELDAGVLLDKNGFTADGVTVLIPVAYIGEQGYANFADVLTAVKGTTGNVITLVANVTISGQNALDALTGDTLDLNGYTLTVNGNSYFSDGTTTFKNGVIVVEGYASDSFFCGYTAGAVIVFDSVVVTGDNYKTGCAIFNANVGKIEIIDSEITVSGDTTGGVIYGGISVISNSEITATNVCRGVTNSVATIENGTSFVFDGGETGLNNSDVTVDGSTVVIKNATKRAVRLGNNTLALVNGSSLSAENCAADIVKYDENSAADVNVSEDSTLNAVDNVTVYVAEVGGVKYETLSEAFAAVTSDAQTVTILTDVTENLVGAYLRGNIVTDNGAKVTITLTNSDWVYFPYTFVLGEDITLKVPALFYYAGGAVINGTVIANAYYQRYAGTKLTINEPGSLTVNSETFILRYTDGDPNAGIYINGDNDDSTVGLKVSVVYFYQGMINAKDATIETSVYWQTQGTDGQGTANLVLDNSILRVTGTENTSAVSGNSTVTLTNNSKIVAAGAFDFATTAAISLDETSAITSRGVSVFAAKIGNQLYKTLGEAVAALADGETLVILKSFTAGANEFIELNGKKNITITAAAGVVINGDISIGYHASHIDSVDRSDSTLTIDGLTVNGTLTVCSNDASFVVSNNKAAQLTVKTYREGMNISLCGNEIDGSIGAAANSYGMFIVPNATAYNLNVSDNTFENVSSHAFVIQGCGDGAAVTYANSISVTDNEFLSWGLGGKDDRAAFKIWADTKYAPASGSNVNETTNAMRELVNAIEAGNNVFASTADNTVDLDIYDIAADVIEIPDPVYEAEIDGVKYDTLEDAINAAQAGDTIVVIKDLSDVAVTVDKNLTIKGNVLLTNVSISGSTGIELAVEDLSFSGNSWINTNGAAKLTVKNVTADVAPNNTSATNSRSAFISLGRSESAQLELYVESCNIVCVSGSNPILGWAAITKADLINNIFGSASVYQNSGDSVKFMAIADGAIFNIVGNTVYSNYNGIVFGQNTTRGNAYTANISGNTFIGGADHIWVEVSGSNTTHAKINASSDNTVNGNAFNAGDIKLHPNLSNFTGYLGVDVEFNAENKVIGGSFAHLNEELLADGYEAVENADGALSVQKIMAAEVNGVKYETIEEAFAAAQVGDEVILLSDIAESVIAPHGIILNGNGKTISGLTAGGDLTFKGRTLIGSFSAGYYNHTITIGVGASVKVTVGRITVSYGNVFNIEGNIVDAKTADKSAIVPSLEVVSGLSFNGNGGGVQFNVTNAYVIFGDSSTKNSGATGEFYLNFNNSIVDFTKTLKTYQPTADGLNPVMNITAEDSAISFASHLELWRSETYLTLKNSDLTVGGSFANAGTVKVLDGSNFVVKAPIMSSHGGNTGTIVIDGGVFELKDSNEDWQNAGTIKVVLGGKLITNDFKCVGEGKIEIDATGYENGDVVFVDGNGVYNFESVTTVIFDRVIVSFENGDVVAKGLAVAKIGNNKYTSLLDALKAAQDGETVEMLADVELYTRLIFSLYTNGKNVTLNGNGYRLYASSTNWGTGNGKHLINVNCDNVTLKNIVLDCNNIAEGANIYMAQNIVFEDVTIINKKGWNADLTVNGSTLTVGGTLSANYVDVSLGKGVTTPLGIVAEDGAVLNVKNLQIASAAYPNTNLDKALATDGTSYYSFKKLDTNGNLAGYSNSLSRLSNGYGYQMLEDATVSSNVTLLNAGHTGTLDTNGYTLTVADGKTLTVNGELAISGTGTVDGDIVLGNADASISGVAGLDIQTNVENAKVEYVNGEYVVLTAVAIIGAEPYYSLADAIAAAQDGETITLLAAVSGDVTVAAGQNIVIDLNGNDIVGTINAIINNGTLVINDAVGTGNVYTTDVSAQGRAAIVNNGTLTINGGWFGDSNNDTTDRNAINRGNAVKNYGTVTINGGYFTNVSNQYISNDAYAYAINTLAGGTTTINNATVYGDINGLIFSNGKTIVNDGSFTLGRPNEENNLWYLAYGDVEIKGGTWSRAFRVPSWNTGDPTFQGDVAVSGGAFDVDVEEQYCAEGFIPTLNADGTYGVKVGKYIAQVGDKKYETLEDAFKAATDGCVIEILADVVIDYKWDCRDYATNGSHSQFKESVTINGNGHTLKFIGTVSDSNWNTIFRFEENATVQNLTVDISEATGAQRVISAKKSLTVDGLTIVGAAKFGIIFGEGASAADLAAAEIVIKNSTLTGTRRAISDNEGGKDVKSVTITGNTLNANVYVSAFETITFNNNTATGEVDLRSYAAESVLAVEAKGNTLNASAKNYICAKTFDAQDEFVAEHPAFKVATKAELDAALAAAVDGDTIILTADIDYGTTQLAIAKAITLDLGGKTLTTRNAYGGMSVKNNPTIKNGTIVHASNTAAIKVWNATAFENLVIDVQGKGDANKTIGGIVLQSGSTTRVGVIKNVTIKGEALTNGIETYNCGDATENVIGSMENVTIDANGTGMLISAPCGTATNCTISGDINAIEISIKGTYSASLDLVDCDVEGGIFAHDEFSSNPDIVNNGSLNLTVDAATTGADDVTLTLARAENVEGLLKDIKDNAQATVNNTYYATLADAIAAAQSGDTITLLADVADVDATINKNVILDLNDKTITDAYIIVTAEVTIKNGSIKNVNEPYPLVVQNGGQLTIEDVAIEASKSDRAIWVRSGSSLIFNSGSILATKGENNTKTNLIAAIYTDSNTDVTINGGTITVDTPDNKAIGIFGNYTNANVTVNGGKISTSGKNYSYGINVDGDITVNGGEIVTNEKGYGYSSGIRYGNNYALVTATGDVTITGGTITTNGYSGYIVNVGRTYSSNDQTVTITGGTFKNDLSEVEQTNGGHKAPVLIWEGSASAVNATITGGDFAGFSEALLRGENTDLAISGGTFDKAVKEEFCAEGFIPTDLGNGTYGVKTGTFVVRNTTTGVGYESLAEALAVAQDGETITLIWNEGDAPIAMNGAVFGKTVTITGTATVDWSKGFLFIGRGGAGDGTVIFENANLTSASNNASYGIHVSGREKDTSNKYDGTLIINNSVIELDYLINKGTMTLDNSTLTVKNGFSVGGRPAIETESGEDATATITLNNGSKLVVNNHNGMGLGYEAIGVMNVNEGCTFECTQSFLVTAKGTMNVNGGTVKVAGTLTNNGTITLASIDAKLYANEGVNVLCGVDGYFVKYADGAYVLAFAAAEVNGVIYETLADALAAAQAGDTVKLMGDVVYDDIVMLKGVALDLNGYTLDAEGLVAFKNANVIDNGATKGLLKVADKDLFTLSGGAYPMLPVWNEEATGYVFVNVNPQSQLQVKAEDKFTVIYRPSINGGGVTNEAMFADGALDNDLIFKINVLCMKNGEVAETLVFALSENLVKEVYANNKAFHLNIFGATDMFDEYKIEFVIESTSGIFFTAMMSDSFIPTTVSE